MIRYEATSFCGYGIKKVRIERETEHMIWIDGRRCRKETEYERYFECLDDAKKYLLDKINCKIDWHKKDVKRLTEGFAKITRIEEEDL